MRVTVLGKSPAFADAGGACSGYLVEEGATTLLLDIGSGVFGKLRAVCSYTELDAVVISHMHADHCLDLVPFAYALIYSPRQLARHEDGAPHVRLFVPSGGRELLRRIVGSWGAEDLIEQAFDMQEYETRERLEIGSLRLRFHAVPHYLPNTNAIELTSADTAGRVTYGADHGPSEELVEFARDTDLLFVEATLQEPESHGVRGHITPREAGEHGRRAGARRLVVTHVSDEIDEAWIRAEAEGAFGAPVSIAHEGDVYDV